jgi:sugar phosphate isomerase/epimerase
MKLGVYNAILHDRPLPEALKVIAELGLTGIEINTGGFLPAVHVPTMDQILESDAARDDYLGIFEGTGVAIAGLNCNGNPLHPKPEIGAKHADIRRSIRLAERLGQDRVVTMSGLPGGEPGATVTNWIVNAWNSAALDVLDYQWGVAAKFWKETDRLAADHGVKVALELHPQNIVFNTADVHKLIELTGATHVGVELDASHLFWQQMDPVAVVRELGPLVFQAAAKDVRVNTANAALYGVLDNSFRRLSPDENRTNLGGDEWANEWPNNSAWDFVALGRGHDTAYWTEFLRALHDVDPGMLVNIEHEDVSLGRIEGLQVAAKVLRDADAALAASLNLTA